MTATNAAVSSRQRGMSTPSHDHVPGLPRPQSSRPEGHDLDFADMSIPGQDTEEASIHAVSPFLVAKEQAGPAWARMTGEEKKEAVRAVQDGALLVDGGGLTSRSGRGQGGGGGGGRLDRGGGSGSGISGSVKVASGDHTSTSNKRRLEHLVRRKTNGRQQGLDRKASGAGIAPRMSHAQGQGGQERKG